MYNVLYKEPKIIFPDAEYASSIFYSMTATRELLQAGN
jgi:hypothetical protein